MASELTKTSGSIFCGNPITYSVKAETEPTSAEITFHRVKLVVTIDGRDYELSHPASSSEVVEFDISSAFRAAAEAYVYEPVSATKKYNKLKATLKARDVWMRDGVYKDPAPGNEKIVKGECEAFQGKYSDYERRQPNQVVSFSRKPTTDAEIVCVGDKVIVGCAYQEGDTPPSEIEPSSRVFTVTSAMLGTMQTMKDGHRIWVDSPSRKSVAFQFVNSRGVVESIRAWQNKTEKFTGGKNEYVISRFERFADFTRLILRKKASRTELSLCSGFVTYEWALWWINEFGQSNQHWMRHGDMWIPCSVTIDDSLTVVDETKPQMCYVSFTCKPDLDGSLM